MASNKTVRNKLINLYGCKCFLGDIPTDSNYLTLHHIKPVREGRITSVENGALLTRQMHWLFNSIEQLDRSTAEHINEFLKYYKETGDEEAKKAMYYFIMRYCEENMEKERAKVLLLDRPYVK